MEDGRYGKWEENTLTFVFFVFFLNSRLAQPCLGGSQASPSYAVLRDLSIF